jgi:ribosomal protein S12 methylthiotransferase
MKIGFVSLGCPKNLVDSEVMLGLAQGAGHTLTHEASEADVLVVNTCSFIDPAKKESIDAILEMAGHKTNGRCQRLVVTGCLAERYRDELRKEIPEVDAVLGTGEVPGIVQAIEGRDAAPQIVPLERLRQTATPRPTYLYDANTPRTLTTPSHFAYVKIAEGCNYKCVPRRPFRW